MKLILEKRVVPAAVIENEADAIPVANALVEGGLPIIEIMFRTKAAAGAIKAIAAELPDVLVGAGTVLTSEQLQAASDAGAGFCIEERIWHPTQNMKRRRDGSLEMNFETTEWKELVRWILSWQPDVKVLLPKRLRDRIAFHLLAFKRFPALVFINIYPGQFLRLEGTLCTLSLPGTVIHLPASSTPPHLDASVYRSPGIRFSGHVTPSISGKRRYMTRYTFLWVTHR